MFQESSLAVIHAQVGGRKGGGGGGFLIPFFVNFDVFLVDFDAKTQMRGEKPKIQNGRWKKGGRTDPQNLTFPTPS